jgi:hypothetical protein
MAAPNGPQSKKIYLAVPSGLEARPTTDHTGHGFHEIRLEGLAESPPGHVLTVGRDRFRHAAAQLATFRRKIDVSGIEVNGLPQNKTRRGERRA